MIPSAASLPNLHHSLSLLLHTYMTKSHSRDDSMDFGAPAVWSRDPLAPELPLRFGSVQGRHPP